MRRVVLIPFIFLLPNAISAFGTSYLDSLSKRAIESARSEASNLLENNLAPDEWYGKQNPMASWGGWKHAQWGGYLDHLSEGDAVFNKGKKSDYGDDVRWGSEVYLNSLSNQKTSSV